MARVEEGPDGGVFEVLIIAAERSRGAANGLRAAKANCPRSVAFDRPWEMNEDTTTDGTQTGKVILRAS